MRTIAGDGWAETEVRRSRFLCSLARAGTEARAQEFIASVRREHRTATHNCTAYVLGERGEIGKSSDDGEPAGTAGVPMLEVLHRRGLTNVVAVVTRHFGGVKLGAGGLVRAYGQAVAGALDAVGLVELRPVRVLTVSVAHDVAGRFVADLHGRGADVADVRYGGEVAAVVRVPEEDVVSFTAWAAEATAGTAAIEPGACEFAEVPVR